MKALFLVPRLAVLFAICSLGARLPLAAASLTVGLPLAAALLSAVGLPIGSAAWPPTLAAATAAGLVAAGLVAAGLVATAGLVASAGLLLRSGRALGLRFAVRRTFATSAPPSLGAGLVAPGPALLAVALGTARPGFGAGSLLFAA